MLYFLKVDFNNVAISVVLQFYKHSMAEYESDLLSIVHSLILSISEKDLHFVKSAPCNASCIRFSLVKLLRVSGYDAAVCASRWQGTGKVPGGKPQTFIICPFFGLLIDWLISSGREEKYLFLSILNVDHYVIKEF